jgi:uncharacterized membrane protein YbhN (UPF0104 family)
MRGNHGKRAEIATVILLDRVFGTLALLVLPLLVVPLFPRLLNSMQVLRALLMLSAAVAAVLLTGLLICFSSRAADGSFLVRLFQTLPLGNYFGRVYDTVHAYRQDARTLLGAAAISMMVHSLLVAVMLLLVQVTSPRGVNGAMAVLIPLGLLANTLPVTPGGLGVGEVAFSKLFYLAGFTGGVEALLGWRVLTAFTALAGWILHMQGQKDFLSYVAGTARSPGTDELSLPVD